MSYDIFVNAVKSHYKLILNCFINNIFCQTRELKKNSTKFGKKVSPVLFYTFSAGSTVFYVGTIELKRKR